VVPLLALAALVAPVVLPPPLPTRTTGTTTVAPSDDLLAGSPA
jgi:hypothetical protein